MDPTGDHVRSTIQFGVKLVVYFCVHKHQWTTKSKWNGPYSEKLTISELSKITTIVDPPIEKMCSIYNIARVYHVVLDPAASLEVGDKSQRCDEHC